MSTKHITNETGMVLDALKGLVAKNGDLALNAQYKGARRSAWSPSPRPQTLS
jgi:hypothetical protein